MNMYVKHSDYVGKDLKLHVGRGDQTIFDNSILEGEKWSRFVAMGFLRKCTQSEVDEVMKGRRGPEEHVGDVKEETAAEAASREAAEKSARAKAAKGEEELRLVSEAEAKAREDVLKSNESVMKSTARKVQSHTNASMKRAIQKKRG